MNENKYNYFLDIHCHYEEINPLYLKQKLKENKIISLTASTNIQTYENLEKIRLKNIPNLYFAYGLHPDNVIKKEINDNLKDLEKIDFSKSIAIGEIGLDYKITKNKQKKEEQKKIFEKQLEFAKKLKKPVIIHTRYATKPVLEILSSWTDLKIILHWFGGNETEIDKALSKNYYLTQRFAFPEIKNIKKHFDKIFIETDFPVSYNGENTNIESVIKSYEKFCEKYDIDLTQIKKRTIQNFEKLFKIKL
ncbi:MAG: TatD family hydrolase [Candidatus ainarchaeum sp.]|nr:TatD family hydrolase [Candidatus ainarchaeum sp.]MDD3976245.1 TatD family hydrolase [Candidatus ainarchaeum sp.]